MEVKTCAVCQVTKNIEEFGKGYCKECQRAYAREYRKKYYQICKEEIINYTNHRNKTVYGYKYHPTNKNKSENLDSKPNKKPRGPYKKRFHEPSSGNRPFRRRSRFGPFIKKEKTEDQLIMDKLKLSVRKRMYKFLKIKKWVKRGKFKEYVGCTIDELKAHLESKFTEGMSWENRSQWHIDHIIPLSSAKTPEDLYKLLHYTNLQPLWAVDNLKKGCKMPSFST